jgi:diamine N-acetyltransferase
MHTSKKAASMPEIKPLERKHVGALYSMTILPEQENFVAPNGVTMGEALFEPGSEVFSIWQDETAVGLLAIIDFSHPDAILHPGEDPSSLYVWRLLIDEDHQRRGYGTFALNFAKQMMHDKGLTAVFITSVDKPGSAIPLYEGQGFVRTGRIVDGETELVWRP